METTSIRCRRSEGPQRLFGAAVAARRDGLPPSNAAQGWNSCDSPASPAGWPLTAGGLDRRPDRLEGFTPAPPKGEDIGRRHPQDSYHQPALPQESSGLPLDRADRVEGDQPGSAVDLRVDQQPLTLNHRGRADCACANDHEAHTNCGPTDLKAKSMSGSGTSCSALSCGKGPRHKPAPLATERARRTASVQRASERFPVNFQAPCQQSGGAGSSPHQA